MLALTCVVSLGWGAAGAASPQRAVFKVTLTGTLTKDWTATRTVEKGECTETTRSSGAWRMTVATGRPSTVAFTSPGRRLRIDPAVVRRITGTAVRAGTARVTYEGTGCPAAVQRTCARRRAIFRGAAARLTTPRLGVARFAPTRGSAAAYARPCPDEPSDIRNLRTDLRLADAPLSAADVFDRSVSRFFISGNTTQQTTVEGEYDGRATERVRWTLTFTRVR